MTPGQARGMLLCFAFLLAGVSCNAIYLQQSVGTTGEQLSARPAPAAPRHLPEAAPVAARAAAAPDPPALRIARFAPENAGLQDPGAPAGKGSDPETVRAIQIELKRRGFGPVPSDGGLGLTTRAAIMAYEHDHGLALTATPSEQLLKRLLLGSAEGMVARDGGEAVTPEAGQLVASVQRALALLGYQPGRPDGRLGVETVRAIRDFEVDRGMVPKGRISAELVRQLGDAAARPASR
jgi:peptidoglycan hydrolase-like protein with peptidoglycan-binding domain